MMTADSSLLAATHRSDEFKAGLTERVDREASSCGGGRSQVRRHHYVGGWRRTVSGQQSVTQEMSHFGETTHRRTVRVLNELLHYIDTQKLHQLHGPAVSYKSVLSALVTHATTY